MRRVRDGERLGRMEQRWLGTSSGWMADGSPDQMLRAYDEMIEAYNSLRL